MKLTHLALALTVGLLGLTSWLAFDSHNQVTGLQNQLELSRLQQQGAQQAAAPVQAPQEINLPAPTEINLPEIPVVASQLTKGTAAPAVSLPPPMTTPTAKPHVNMDTSSLPPPMTARQRQVIAMPAIARVKEYHADNGFILIDAGKDKKLDNGMTFALRRGNGIIGRIKIGESEAKESIGDLVAKSVPPGVTVEVGDELIQDLPPEF